MRTLALLTLVALPAVAIAQKEAVVKSAAAQADANWPTALKIWEWAEPGYQEKQSSAALAEIAEKAGFTVKKGVAKIPTAFTAEFGKGKPVIGILGEFDALPQLSQEAVPFRKSRPEGNGYGHACGHHLFGVASLSAAIAIAEEIKAGSLKGTVRFYMCPAEEGGAAKVFMARAGLFADCDSVLHWHPSSRNTAGDATCLARIAVKFRFHGTPAHASGSPEKGRSALDALLLTSTPWSYSASTRPTAPGSITRSPTAAERRTSSRNSPRGSSTSAIRRPRSFKSSIRDF